MIEKGDHPNVRVYEPDPGKKDFTIDRVKELQGEMALAAALPGRRVNILDQAELMNETAQNRLLKTLEEPGDEAILFLIATHPEALRPTILSRVQRIRFDRLPPEDIEKRLVADADLNKDDARMISRLCGGSLGKALELAQEGEIDTGETWIDVFARLPEMHPDEASEKLMTTVRAGASKKAEERRRLCELLALVSDFWRDVLALQASPKPSLLMPAFEDRAHALAGALQTDTVLRILEHLFQTREDLARNAHSQTAVTALMIRCHRTLSEALNVTLGSRP